MQEVPGKPGVFGIGSKPYWIGHIAAGPIILDREVFRSCGQSLRLERPAGGCDLCGIYQYVPELKAGRKYRLSFFVKLTNVHDADGRHPGAGFYVQLRFGTKDPNTVFRPLRQAFRGDVPWTRLGYTFTALEGTGEAGRSYLEFRLGEGAKGTVWIDHVDLCEVKEPMK